MKTNQNTLPFEPVGTISEVDVVYKKSTVKIDGKPFQIQSPEDAVCYLAPFFRESGKMELQEQFRLLLLDNAKQVIGQALISTGGATATIVDPASVFRLAILSGAYSIILSHNHPSGQLRESRADINLTNRLVKGGKMLGIPVDDHIILTNEGHISFRSKGLI